MRSGGITLFLLHAIPTYAFVSAPLRVHRQVLLVTDLFSCPSSFPIEVVETSPDDGSKCIRIADINVNETILGKMDKTAWLVHPSQNGSHGLFLSYVPCSEHISNVDVKLGEWYISHSHNEDHVKWLACARQTRYWMGPAFGKASFNAKDSSCLPLDTQFLLAERKHGQSATYTLILPLVDGSFRSSLQSGRDTPRKNLHSSNKKITTRKDSIVVHIDSFDENVYFSSQEKSVRAVYIIVGSDPYQILKQGFRDVADELKTFETLDRKKIPPMVDKFGWCTWDAFYSDVTPEGVLEGVSSLTKAGVQPKTVIIDDGWQTVSPVKTRVKAAGEAIEKRRRIDRVASSLLSIVSKGVSAYYDRYVKTNKYNSFPNRIWRRLSKTILKGELYKYFDSETDFARQLSGFEANDKFRLGALVSKLKRLGVTQVICWHALHGYWRGISPKLASSLNQTQAALPLDAKDHLPKHSHHLLRVEPVIAWDSVSLFGCGIVTEKDSLDAFFDGIHSILVDSGVDGVKIDVQSGLAAVGGGVGGGPHLAKLYVEAMEKSVQRSFSKGGGISCINCMSHSTENLYRYKQTSVIRASDDFYPKRDYSHTVHIINVAYNSLFLKEICLPDWDMFHSKHSSAYLHGAARAVSGGMIYVSDKPDQHDVNLLRRLVLKDGSVLRASQSGVPTRDCLFTDVGRDGVTALKISNFNENSNIALVAAFNVQGVQWSFDDHKNVINNESPHQVVAAVRAEDVEMFRGMSGRRFVAYSHRSQMLTLLDTLAAEIRIPLKHREWELVSISPIYEMDEISFTPIGLVDMFNSGGAITSMKMNQSRVEILCRGSGRFLVYSSCRPSNVTLSDEDQQQQGPAKVTAKSLSFGYNPESGELLFILDEANASRKLMIHWT